MKKSTESNAYSIICPTCAAWAGKKCKHTNGSKKGKNRTSPHPTRVRLAAVKMTEKQKNTIATLGVTEKVAPKKNPKEKLNDEQKHVVDVVLEKIGALSRHAEFVGPVSVGPIISTYRFFPLKRTKVIHLEAMQKDFAVALGAEAIVVKRMPGESAVGVFVPNKTRQKVTFRDTLANVRDFMEEETEDKHKPIPINFGVNSDGKPVVGDLTMLPHLLVAGTTGSGKSTFMHCVVESIGWTMEPSEVQLMISDTKGVEFAAFRELPHLRVPIATDLFKTMHFLDDCVKETQRRLDVFALAGVRNIHEYNSLQPEGKKMSYWVCVIDELADLMGPALEREISKANSDRLGIIVARARASGIHVVAGTQRPDVKQIKGSIKANFPARLSFRLPSAADSKTILSTKGAESLMMKGDAFYVDPLSSNLQRIHSPYTSIEDTRDIVKFIAQRENDKKEALDVVLDADDLVGTAKVVQ